MYRLMHNQDTIVLFRDSTVFFTSAIHFAISLKAVGHSFNHRWTINPSTLSCLNSISEVGDITAIGKKWDLIVTTK